MDRWGSIQLHHLLDFVIGGDWGKKPDYVDDDYTEVRWIRGTEIRNWKNEHGVTAARRKIEKTSLTKRKLEAGDIILEVSGGGPEQPVGRVELIGNSALANDPGIPKVCTNFFRRLKPNKEINPSYLMWFLKHFYQSGEITKYQGGSNNLRNLKFKDYSNLEVPVAPLNEQHRIIEKIDTLFAELDQGEAALEQTLTLLKRYRQSQLKAAVTGSLTRDWRAAREDDTETGADLLERILTTRREHWEADQLAKMQARGKPPKTDAWKNKYKQPAQPDTTDLPALPDGWVWASMDQISDVIGGLTKNSKRKELPLRKPMLRVANVYQGRLDLDNIHETGVKESELQRVLLEYEDILAVEGNGSKEQIGRMAIWRNEIEDAVHQNHLIKIRLYEKRLAELAMCWFQSGAGRQNIEKVASSTSGLYTLSLSKVKSLVMPIPSLEESLRIVEYISQAFAEIDQLETHCQTELARSKALRQSILKDAFAGKLVPQDPSDEPASDLLARIQAKRAARPAKGRKREAGAK